MQVMSFRNKRDALIVAGLVILLCIGMFIFEHFWLLPGYFFVKLLFAVFFSLTSVFSIGYIFFDHQAIANQTTPKWFERNSHLIIIVVAIIFVYSPLLTEGYYWYDDFWIYPGTHASDWLGLCISMMRPFHGLLCDMFWFVLPSNAYYLKWLSIACLICYALVLHKWLLQKSEQRFLSLMVTLALSLFSPLSDHLGYSGTIGILPGMLAASLSVIMFDAFFEKANTKERAVAIIFAIVSGCTLLFSFMLYQISSPIVFLFLIIYIYFDKRPTSSVRFVFLYMFFFGLCAVFYLLIGKLLVAHYGTSVWSRGNLIGVQDILPKVVWFFHTVIPAVFDRLGIAFLGRLATSVKCYWHFVQYDSALLRIIVSLVFVTSIVVVCIFFMRHRKKIIDLLLMIACIPMSYYCFLVLKEDGYVTYYAIPLLSVIFFFFLVAIKETVFLFNRTKGIDNFSVHPEAIVKVAIIFMICILAFQNNLYIRQFWVETSKEGYHYLKNTLSSQVAEKKKIHVFGVLIPGQGNIYSVFATKVALRELDYNPDSFTITSSDSDRTISVIQEDILEKVKKHITPDELQFILSSYIYDSTYKRYVCNINPNMRLTEILIKTGLLPGNYNETAIVDLQWIKPTWPKTRKDTKEKFISKNNEITPSPPKIIGHLQTVEYSYDEDIVIINGWAAIENIDSTESQVSIILKSFNTSIQLSDYMIDSPDVVTYFKNENYEKCRINFSLDSVSSKMKPGIYEVWISVVNEKMKAKASLLWGKRLEIKGPGHG